jgi:hypothetical protein
MSISIPAVDDADDPGEFLTDALQKVAEKPQAERRHRGFLGLPFGSSRLLRNLYEGPSITRATRRTP